MYQVKFVKKVFFPKYFILFWISINSIIAYTESEIQSIVASRNEAAALKIEQVRNNTKLQIEALKVKYAIPDAIKTTSGFTAIISLGALALLVVFTDSLKYIILKNKKPAVNKIQSKKEMPLYVQQRK